MGTSFQWCKMWGTLFLWAFGRDHTSIAKNAKCKNVKSGSCYIQSMFDFMKKLQGDSPNFSGGELGKIFVSYWSSMVYWWCLSTWRSLDPAVILLPNILLFIALWIIQECAHVVSACFLIPFTKLCTFFNSHFFNLISFCPQHLIYFTSGSNT
jgi:hypothetical protein